MAVGRTGSGGDARRANRVGHKSLVGDYAAERPSTPLTAHSSDSTTRLNYKMLPVRLCVVPELCTNAPPHSAHSWLALRGPLRRIVSDSITCERIQTHTLHNSSTRQRLGAIVLVLLAYARIESNWSQLCVSTSAQGGAINQCSVQRVLRTGPDEPAACWCLESHRDRQKTHTHAPTKRSRFIISIDYQRVIFNFLFSLVS